MLKRAQDRVLLVWYVEVPSLYDQDDPRYFPGIYSVLFLLCIYVLCSRRRSGYQTHLAFMSTLFVLSSGHLILNVVMGCKGFAPVYLLEDLTFLNPATAPSSSVSWGVLNRLFAEQSSFARAIMSMLFLSKYVSQSRSQSRLSLKESIEPAS